MKPKAVEAFIEQTKPTVLRADKTNDIGCYFPSCGCRGGDCQMEEINIDPNAFQWPVFDEALGG